MSSRPPLSPPVLRAGIAGAGIGGLTAALALLRAGIDVDVYDQAGAFGEAGAGIQLSANGTRCLFSLGLEQAIRERASEPAGKEIRLWSSGQRWKLFDLGARSVDEYGFPYLMMHRADLHAVLAAAVEAIKPGAVRLGARCTGHAETEGGIALHFEDRRSEVYDVAIGADGVHSAFRERLFGTGPAWFTGCMAWRGLVPASQVPPGLAEPVGTNWVGPGAHVITYPVRAGELVNFVGVVERADWTLESWNEQGTAEECSRDFEGWHPDIHRLIQAIGRPYKWALLGREPMAQWGKGRATLLGDACHPTLPFLAQGAMMAIEDGVVLARCLSGIAHDPPAALRRYEALRMERTARIVRGSADNARRFHNPALAHAAGAAEYVEREWTAQKVKQRYGWLFEYDALAEPVHA